MTSCISPPKLLLRVIVVAGAIGSAAPASVALAQGSHGGKSASSAAASKPGSVAGVIVQAPPKSNKIPPEKKAGFDAEATKRKAWQKYRATIPAPRPVLTAGASASARAENYPGLHTLPH
jgi:hypothetical protein